MDTEQDWEELSRELDRDYTLGLRPRASAEEGETLLAAKLNALIRDDFNALVRLLYRIDVSESRLRQLLDSNKDEDAGRIMARLIMERQLQKIQTRRQFKAANEGKGTGAADPGSEEERW